MEALGINLLNLIIYTVLFLIVFLLLSKFLFPALNKSIDERMKLLEDNKKREKDLDIEEKEAKERLASDEKTVLLEARKQSEKIVSDAETEAADIVKKSQSKAGKILDDAKASLKIQEEKLNNEFKASVRSAAVKITKEIYGKDFDMDPEKFNKLLESINL